MSVDGNVTLSCVPTENPLSFPDSSKDPPSLGGEPNLEASLPHSDSGLGEEQMSSVLNGADLDPSPGGPNGIRGLLCTLSSEVKSHESLSEASCMELLKPASSISSISQANKGINVKEILKSLVAAPLEATESGPEPLPYPDHQALKREAQAMLPMQFHSFDRYSSLVMWWGYSGVLMSS